MGITQKPDHIINGIRFQYFASFPGKYQELKLDVPQERLLPLPFPYSTDDFAQEYACGGFNHTYESVCSYYKVIPRPDIEWDINNVLSRSIHQFDFRLFQQPITIDDVKALTATLRFVPYFTTLVLDRVAHVKELFMSVVELVRRSEFLENLIFSLLDLPKDQGIAMARAITDNKNLPLKSLELSNIELDEKVGNSFLYLLKTSPKYFSEKRWRNLGISYFGRRLPGQANWKLIFEKLRCQKR